MLESKELYAKYYEQLRLYSKYEHGDCVDQRKWELSCSLCYLALQYTKLYGYTILSWTVIFQIVQIIVEKNISSVIEVLCGTGYITYFVNSVLDILSNNNSVKIVASDINLKSAKELGFYDVLLENSQILELDAVEHIRSTQSVEMLIMSWPPCNSIIAINTLKEFMLNNHNKNKCFVYFGIFDEIKSMGKKTGDDEFNGFIKELPIINTIYVDNLRNICSMGVIYDCSVC
jgi:hypothetical protein